MLTYGKPVSVLGCGCGLYIDGMDYQELCRREGLEKKWQTELAMQGRDYAVAIRTAHIMQKLGLIDVDVRMNGKVEFVTPQSVGIANFFSDNPDAGYTFLKGQMISYGKKAYTTA